MANKKQDKTMAEVTAGYDEFIKRQKVKETKSNLFENTLKKAAKPKPKKQRGSK